MSISQVGREDHYRRPKSPQGAPQPSPGHPQKTVCVFSGSRALPEEPPGPPQGLTRDAGTLLRTPRDLPETSQDSQEEPPRARGPPQNPPEKPRDTPDPLKQARRNARSD